MQAKLNKNELEALFPGLSAIQAAIDAEEAYDYAFEQMMDRGTSGRNLPPKPAVSSENLLKQFPAAAAYRLARSYSRASNVDKFAAGRKAVNRLEAGEAYQTVIAEMKQEWSGAADRSVWNS